MKIKADKIIKERSEYYYETVMIISQRKTSLLKKKSFYLKSTYSSEIKRAVFIVILFLIQSFVIFSSTISWYLFIIPYLIVILLMLYSLFLVVGIKIATIKSEKNRERDSIFIDKQTITFSKSDGKEIVIKTENIFALAVGKYSVVILPNDTKSSPISMPIEYEKDLLDALKKENIQVDIIKANDKPLNINNKIEKKEEIKNHPKLIVFLSITLFVLSILSFFVGIILEVLLDNKYRNTLICNDWVYLYCLIIPMISIIFGLYFKNKKVENNILNTKLNIIGGIIVFIILFLMGEDYIFPANSSELFNPYEEYINLQIPDKTVRTENCVYGFEEEKYIWHYNLIVTDFTKKDGKNFADTIKSSDKWIISDNVDTKYVDSLPLELKINDHTYIYKYDKTNDEINVFNKKKGTNYVFTYDIISNHFEIHEYTLSQKRK